MINKIFINYLATTFTNNIFHLIHLLQNTLKNINKRYSGYKRDFYWFICASTNNPLVFLLLNAVLKILSDKCYKTILYCFSGRKAKKKKFN